jgi:hypothetical protein
MAGRRPQWPHGSRRPANAGIPSERDDRGVETVKVTNEAPMCAYQAEWKRLMSPAEGDD